VDVGHGIKTPRAVTKKKKEECRRAIGRKKKKEYPFSSPYVEQGWGRSHLLEEGRGGKKNYRPLERGEGTSATKKKRR